MQLFETAEIAKFTPTERETYQQSLKHYRDWYNVLDTAEREGREKGWQEGREEGREEGAIRIVVRQLEK